MRIAIVGAGMAGLACAEGLAGSGHDVVLFDKGRAAGGRMSTRRIATAAGQAHFDLGAQYFTVRDDRFRRRVDRWLAADQVAPWPSAGNHAYVGVPAMNAPLRDMAQAQAVQWSTRVTRLDRRAPGWRLTTNDRTGDDRATEVDCTVVALPAEQTAALLASVAPDLAARATATPSKPCWTALLAFSEAVPVRQDYLSAEGVIASASRNNSKTGRHEPESWVVHAGPEWSTHHLEAEPDEITRTLRGALAELLGVALPPVISASSHRWRFARSGADGAGALWDAERRLGVCGDWLLGPRVEAAWLSGTLLAGRMSGGGSDAP